MNGLPRPDFPPLPAPPGQRARVRRRGLLRRTRVPAGTIFVAALAIALVNAPLPGPDDTLRSVGTPASPAASSTYSPSERALPTPSQDRQASTSPASPQRPTPRRSASRGPDVLRPPGTPSPQPWNPCADNGPDVTGQVVDESGRPLANITVNSMLCPKTGRATEFGRVALTDANGRFRVHCTRTSITVGTFQWQTGELSTDAQVGFDWIYGYRKAVPCGFHHRIVLRPSGTLKLTIVNSAGEPVAHPERVMLFEPREGASPVLALFADANGQIVMPGLTPGTGWHARTVVQPGSTPRGRPRGVSGLDFDIVAGTVTEATLVLADVESPSPSPSATPPDTGRQP